MSRFNMSRRLGMAALATTAAFTLLLAGASGATADTPIPTPATDPMPLPAGEPLPVPANEPVPSPAHITVTNMPGFGAPKPHAVHANAAHTNTVSPSVSYVGLAALPANEPVYGQIPLTAQTDQDLTTTPYYILIVDDSTGQVVKYCGTGSSCGIYVSSAAAVTKNYTAYVAPWATTLNGIQDIQAFSQPQTVEWFHVCG